MGATRSRVQRREANEVWRDVTHSAQGVCEAKGRVLCVSASEDTGLVLVGTQDAVLAWRLKDATYYRAFPTGTRVECVAASREGLYALAGTYQDGRPTVRRLLLTKRLAPAAFELYSGSGSVRGGGYKKGLEQALDSAHAIHPSGAAAWGGTDWLGGEANEDLQAIVSEPSRILTFADDPALVCVCAPPHAIVWNLLEDAAQTILSGAYPRRDAPLALMEQTKHFVVGRGSTLRLVRWDGTSERTVAVTALPRRGVEVLLVRGLSAFCAGGSVVAKVNVLSGAQLYTWQADGRVSCLEQIGGIVFSCGASDTVQMWDGKCGRRLGACAVTQTRGIRPQGLHVAGTTLVVADDPEEGKGFQSLVKLYDVRDLLEHCAWLPDYDPRFSADYKRPTARLETLLHLTGPGAGTLTTAQEAREAGGHGVAGVLPDDPGVMLRLAAETEGALSLEEVQQCRRLFLRHDLDRNGVIGRMEFQNVAAELRQVRATSGDGPGPLLTLADTERIFHGWDTRGGLPFDEFVRALARHFGGSALAAVRRDDEWCARVAAAAGDLTVPQVKALRVVFHRYDLNDDKQLDRAELIELLRDAAEGQGGAPFADAFVDRLWDQRGEGETALHFEPFVTAVARCCTAAQRASILASGRRRAGAGARRTSVWDPPTLESEKFNPASPGSPASPQAGRTVAELMRGLRREGGEEERPKPRRDSTGQKQRYAADPQRVVLCIRDDDDAPHASLPPPAPEGQLDDAAFPGAVPPP
eukprot:TRINITY_DN6860_c0_g1_i8.p1 TRINITY_DN6860_c0_g1~~TRINITY_DN6860_c0_g1_i8.p1  ORF type:complete len:754 (+),score=214.92 TRINITY_DN6860_c0_g1_i8:85-2346(+)